MSKTFDRFVLDHQKHPDAPVPGAIKVYGMYDDPSGSIAFPAGWLMPQLQNGETPCDTSTSPTMD